jgi:iron complex outermembrane receptor protein
MNVRSVAALVVLACTTQLSALAQKASDRDTTSYRMREIRVESSQYARDVDPVTQTTVTKAAVEQLYIGQDVQYVLERTVPSIIAYSESGTAVSNYGTFRLRGIDQTRVNVTLDGVPLNDMIDQGVFFSNIGDLMNGMSSVQVQRGTGLSTNGTASFAGAVGLSSPSLSLYSDARRPMANVQLSGGSFNMLRGSAAIRTGAIDSSVNVYARFTTLATDGYRRHTGTNANSAHVAARWQDAENTNSLQFTGLWGRTQNQLGYFPVPKATADADPRTNLNDSADVDDFGQHLMSLAYQHVHDENTVFSATGYIGGAGGDFFTGFRDAEGALTLLNYPLENRHYGAIARVDSRISDVTIRAGVHAYPFRRRNWETIAPEFNRPYYDDRTTKNEVSAFTRFEYTTGALSLLADLQLRTVHMSFSTPTMLSTTEVLPVHRWAFLNPRIGARFELSSTSDIYASFGRTSREPTRFDLLGGTQITAANLPVLRAPNTVRPEHVNDIELGYRMSSEAVTLDVTAFAMFFTDEIAPIGPYIDQLFVQLRKNVESSRRLGLEVMSSVRLHRTLHADIAATLMTSNVARFAPENLGVDTVFTNVTPILTPSAQVLATLRYMPIDPLTIEAGVRYISSSFTDLTNADGLVLPEVVDVNARVWWNIAGEHRIGVMANNLLDAMIVTNGGSTFDGTSTVPTYFVQAGRNFMVMLDLRF